MHKARSLFFVWRAVGARECARLGLTPLLLGLISALAVLPSASRAQPPTYITQWGTEGSGNGQFELPHGVAVDAGGNVYVADTNNGRIQKFTGSGSYVTQWGAGAQSVAVDARARPCRSIYTPGRAVNPTPMPTHAGFQPHRIERHATVGRGLPTAFVRWRYFGRWLRRITRRYDVNAGVPLSSTARIT